MSRRRALLGGMAATAIVAASAAALGSAIDPTRIPLGDGKVSTTTAQVGWVFTCQQKAVGHGAPTKQSPTWIRSDGTWDSTAKPVVDGQVKWRQAKAKVTWSSGRASVSANGLPVGHASGTYPIGRSDDAYAFDPNPNRIQQVTLNWSLPAPVAAASPGCLSMGAVGVAVNGIVIYNALDQEWRDAVANELQDACGGHPGESGQYHYHSIPSCLTKKESAKAHSGVVGWARDGFPIAGPRGDGGVLLTNADLDVCHGHTGAIVVSGKKATTLYHYHATAEYPYTLSCFHGTADASTESKMGGGAGKQPGQGGMGPPQGGQGGMGPPQGGQGGMGPPQGGQGGMGPPPPGGGQGGMRPPPPGGGQGGMGPPPPGGAPPPPMG